MKTIFMLIILIGFTHAFATETSSVTCTLSQGILTGKKVHSVTVNVENKVPFFINPTQFSIDGAYFSGEVFDGNVQAAVMIGENKIIGSSGSESSVSLLRANQTPLLFVCKFN